MSKNIPNKKIYAMVISYKSSPVLHELYQRIDKENFDKVYFFDDNSPDDSAEKAKKFDWIVIKNENNLGHGGNLKKALKTVFEDGADYGVEIHADNQYSPNEVIKAKDMIDDNFDLVIGSRFKNKNPFKQDGMPFMRYFTNKTMSLITSSLFGINLTEFHTGCKIFSKNFFYSIPIKNTSDKNILFDPSKIKVKSKDKKKKKSKTLSHLSKQKIQDKFDKSQMWDDVLTGLAVLGEALDDSPTSTSETSGSIAGDLFNATTESFSEKDKEESIDSLIDDAEQVRNQSIKTERSLNDILIGKTTIFPGETITGSVLIHYNWDYKKAYYIDFDIILDEDTHNFSYKATGRV